LRRLLALLLALPAAGWASHPLITEDTGVLGSGVWQLEVHGEQARDSENGVTSRALDASAVLSYGLSAQADLQVELPYVKEEAGTQTVKGRGDATVSLKWRFFEREGLSLVLKPDLYLPTGRDELGLGAGRTRWALNAVAGYAFGRIELLAHAGYLDNRNTLGERESLRHASVAALFSASDRLKLALDLGRDTNPDPASGASLREMVLGLLYALSEDVDLGLGVKWGLSEAADDRALLAGVKLRF
jgi:hypothetical protein